MPSHKKRIYTRIKFLYRLLELFFLQRSHDQFLTPQIFMWTGRAAMANNKHRLSHLPDRVAGEQRRRPKATRTNLSQYGKYVAPCVFDTQGRQAWSVPGLIEWTNDTRWCRSRQPTRINAPGIEFANCESFRTYLCGRGGIDTVAMATRGPPL